MRRALVVLVVLAVTGCNREPSVSREAGLNVLLITIDTLRADALGAYGKAGAGTPVIDRVAAGGVRFANARAHNVVTLPSHVNILSGLYPYHHGVRENAGFRVPRPVETLATLLQAQGYRTGAFVSAFPLDRRFGLDRGFDVYDDAYGKSEEHSAFRVPERAATETVSAARRWIDMPAPNPYFAWVHVYEPHFPYSPPEPFATTYRQSPYAGEVAAVDAALAPILQPILERGADARTLVVITSDHGESLGEHGEMTHGLFAYEATVHVPLIVYAPRLLKPRVVAETVRHVDIAPTILEAIARPAPNGLDGRSVLAMAAGGETMPAPSYFESLSASLNRGWAPLYGLSRGPLKYVELPIPELYDLAADPGETSNLAGSRLAEVRELQSLLASYRASDQGAQRGSESAETRERLRSLGYLTGTSAAKTRFTEADDPKRLIDIDRAIEDVVSRYQQGDIHGAIALGRDLLQRRPDMPLTLVHLAFLYNEAGDHKAAAETIRRALALNPAAADVAALAGAYLTEAGLAREASVLLAAYATASGPDVDVLIAYGVALASDHRPQDALAAFDRARTMDPANALPIVNIATVHLMSGDREGAARGFSEAIRLDPRSARAHNGLGVIAAERQAYAEAIAHWQQAVAIDPRDYQTLYNLGDVLIRLGRNDEARTFWQHYVEQAPAAEAADVIRVRQWLARH